MSKLVRGDRLPSNLRREVLAGYPYRWTSDNPSRDRAWRGIEGAPTIPLVSDAQWLRDHAFYVTDRGTLDKRRKSAEPAYLAEDEGGSHATKKASPAHQKTPCIAVVFRVFPEGDVIALFPNEDYGQGLIMSYLHVGQHGGASRQLIKELRVASAAEYAPLLAELKSIGYCLRVKR